MTEVPYSNRELEEKFREVHGAIQNTENNLMQTLARIEAQTTKTNGRVNKLEEKEVAARTRINTALALILVLVIPIIIYAFQLAIACSKADCK